MRKIARLATRGGCAMGPRLTLPCLCDSGTATILRNVSDPSGMILRGQRLELDKRRDTERKGAKKDDKDQIDFPPCTCSSSSVFNAKGVSNMAPEPIYQTVSSHRNISSGLMRRWLDPPTEGHEEGMLRRLVSPKRHPMLGQGKA